MNEVASIAFPAAIMSEDLSAFDELGRQLRLAVDSQDVRGTPERAPSGINDVAEATLRRVQLAADTFRKREAAAHALAGSALQELSSATQRIEELESLVHAAETRARRAERWLLALRSSVDDALADWQAESEARRDAPWSSFAGDTPRDR
jgi:hypothetical protein